MFDIAHIHPILIHFPLALLPAALLFQAVALVQGKTLFDRDSLASSAIYLVVLAGIAALLAALFGDMAMDVARDAGISEDIMEEHEELGIMSAWLMAGLAALEGWFFYKKATSITISRIFFVAGIVLMGSLVVTAWHGGELVYQYGINVAAK